MDWLMPTAWTLVALGLTAALVDLVLGTAGLLVGIGTIMVVAGVATAFSHSPGMGLTVLATTTIALPLVGWFLARIFPWTPLGRSVLARSTSVDATVSEFRSLQELEHLEGRLGVAQSYLRPSGVVDFEGRRIDCITEGLMVDPGQVVRCLKVSASRVLVRPVSPGEETPLASIDSDLFELIPTRSPHAPSSQGDS